MKRYIAFILLFTASLYGNFQVSYLDTKINYKDINDVINSKFINISSKISFGLRKNVWLKVSIGNNKNTKIENYLSISNLHILENVHFFTVHDNKVVNKNTLFHKYKNPNTPNRIGNSLVYRNSIKPNDKIDVYIYVTAKRPLNIPCQSSSDRRNPITHF